MRESQAIAASVLELLRLPIPHQYVPLVALPAVWALVEPGPRVMQDIDVFVAERDVDRAVEISTARGFTPDVTGRRRRLYRMCRGQLALVAGAANLDLHWWLNNNPLQPVATALSFEAVMAASHAGRWQGVPVRFPSPADAVLLNAVYMYCENWGQFLRAYMDHAVLLRTAVWPKVLERAREVGVLTLLAKSVQDTQRVTQSLPEEVLGDANRQLPGRRVPRWLVARDVLGEPTRTTRLVQRAFRTRNRLARFLPVLSPPWFALSFAKTPSAAISLTHAGRRERASPSLTCARAR